MLKLWLSAEASHLNLGILLFISGGEFSWCCSHLLISINASLRLLGS